MGKEQEKLDLQTLKEVKKMFDRNCDLLNCTCYDELCKIIENEEREKSKAEKVSWIDELFEKTKTPGTKQNKSWQEMCRNMDKMSKDWEIKKSKLK